MRDHSRARQEHDPWDDEEDDVIVNGDDDLVKKPAPLTNAEGCRYVRGAQAVSTNRELS